MKRFAALVWMVCTAATAGWSQSYSFSVPRVEFQVTAKPDASVDLDYRIEFSNSPGAHAIDVVDIGLPHAQYDFSNMTASVNGAPLSVIKRSQYVKPGVEVHLQNLAIPAGGSGTFRFHCNMPNLVYQDTTDKTRASLRITPTWFGSKYVTGTTDLQIAVHLPPGADPDRVVYQLGKAFAGKYEYRGHLVVHWAFPGVRLTEPHLVGVSFPKDVMDRVVTMTPWQLLAKWYRERIVQPFTASKTLRWLSALLFLGVLVVWWRRFAGKTGGCILVLLLFGSVVLVFKVPGVHLLSWPVLLLVLLLTWRLREHRRRHYLPPVIEVEGGGIKRGLTAPEAAVILELPLNKVLTLVLTGLLKKKLVQQVAPRPLRLRLNPRYAGTKKERLNNAQHDGVVIHNYEHLFLDVLERGGDRPVVDLDFEDAIRELIHQTARKMKGFDLGETRDYYRYIVAKAWREAGAVGRIPEREKKVDKYLEWLILDDEFDRRFHRWGRRGYTYCPPWSRPVGGYPGRGGPTSGAAARAPAPASGGRTSFSDVAASFVGSAENLMGSTAVKLDPISVGVGHGAGVVNLSGFDKVAGDFFKAMASSSGGGGGGGGCACACAGCACACACAGGGR